MSFASKFSASLQNLLSSTVLGRYDVPIQSHEAALGMALDSNANPYIVGYTNSEYFPTISGSYDVSYNGEYDGFLLKIDNNLSNGGSGGGGGGGDGEVAVALLPRQPTGLTWSRMSSFFATSETTSY